MENKVIVSAWLTERVAGTHGRKQTRVMFDQ